VKGNRLRHRDLEVWSDGVQLVEMVYEATRGFPNDERFGLVAQLRRAAISVPANIAEGAARRSRAELIQFLHVARGSLAEIETHLEIAKRLKYVQATTALDEVLERVFAKLSGLINSLREKAKA
jgi:four helix bundle protein